MSGSQANTDVDWQYIAETDKACIGSGLDGCSVPRGKMLGKV